MRCTGFTVDLAREHGVVVVEHLATKNLMANRSLAQAIGDQGWGELARQLGYKTARHGGQLVVAGRWSKTCSVCRGAYGTARWATITPSP